MQDVPYGFCHCGCGQKTSIARQSVTDLGHVRGEPVRFVVGHGRCKSGAEYAIDETTGCWIWQRSTKGHTGYGQLRDANGSNRGAHRLYYERYKGPVPAGMFLDHLCRNRLCVNPEHLEPVTPHINVQRGIGAKLTPADVRAIRRLAATTTEPELAQRFNVSVGAISAVKGRRTWANIAD